LAVLSNNDLVIMGRPLATRLVIKSFIMAQKKNLGDHGLKPGK
jgi:hypothetical protein